MRPLTDSVSMGYFAQPNGQRYASIQAPTYSSAGPVPSILLDVRDAPDSRIDDPHRFAISVNAEGDCEMQLVKNGQTRIIDLWTMLEFMEKHWGLSTLK